MDFNESNMMYAKEKIDKLIADDAGKLEEKLEDNLLEIAGVMDGKGDWQTALFIHQKIDELFPNDFGNKGVLVNYLYKSRTSENAAELMASMARGYSSVIKSLAASTKDDSLRKYKLTLDMMANISRFVLKDILETSGCYGTAMQSHSWREVLCLADTTLEEIKACFAVGDTVLAYFPNNEELQEYVCANWAFYYPLYEAICRAEIKDCQPWYTEQNVHILSAKALKIREYRSNKAFPLLKTAFGKIKAVFMGTQEPRKDVAWQKAYRESSALDYKDLDRFKKDFIKFSNSMARIFIQLGAYWDYYTVHDFNSQRNLKIKHAIDDNTLVGDVYDWDIRYSPLYYWHAQNIYHELFTKKVAAKSDAATAEQKPGKCDVDDNPKHKFVSVRFKNSAKTYDYLADGIDVAVGDVVKVLTNRGESEVEVANIFWSDGTNMALPFRRYKAILGKAEAPITKHDPRRFVHVVFNSTSYKYSYACPDTSINVGDFVLVNARGEEKIARVADVYTSSVDNYRPVLGRATELEIKENIFEFMGDDDYRDESAYDRFLTYGGHHDCDLDEDDYAILTYVEVYLPEYKHTAFYLYDDLELVKGDVVAVDTIVGKAEGVVKKVIYELQKNSDEDLCMMRKVLYKLRDNPNTAQRNAALEKQNARKWKLEEKADNGLAKGWQRVEHSNEELATSFKGMAVAGTLAAASVAGAASIQHEPTQQELLISPEYWWHPMNLYYDEDKASVIDHNRMVDDNGNMINGKLLAEHERNAGSGVYDSNGFAKDPDYEEALADNFELADNEGIDDYN